MDNEILKRNRQESLVGTIDITGARTAYNVPKDAKMRICKVIISEMMRSCSGQGGGISPCGGLCPDDQYFLYLMDHQDQRDT